MRRLILLCLVVFLCFSMTAVYAAISGAETQGKGKLGIGVEQDIVFNRDMKYAKGTEGLDCQNLKIDSMSRTMTKISYGLLDNLDIYAKLGVANTKAKGKANDSFSGEEGIYNVKANNAFAWGLGAKATYEFDYDWLLGVDAQYLRHKHNGHVTFADSDSWKADYTFQEWQITPYIAKKIGKFLPYAGIGYSNLAMKHKDEDGKVKFKAKKNWGASVGTSYQLTENSSLSIEGRFVDQTAVNLACNYKF